jgi:hypothetical protein
MSWSMGSIDCIAVKIDNDYIKALKKDVEDYLAKPKQTLEDMSEEKQKQFKELLDTLEANDLEDVDTFYGNYCDYIHYYDSDNYTQEIKIDFESGECDGKVRDFEGYVLEISWGSSSIYKPEFSTKEALKEAIDGDFYMPKTFNWQDKLIFLTGVWEG